MQFLWKNTTKFEQILLNLNNRHKYKKFSRIQKEPLFLIEDGRWMKEDTLSKSIMLFFLLVLKKNLLSIFVKMSLIITFYLASWYEWMLLLESRFTFWPRATLKGPKRGFVVLVIGVVETWVNKTKWIWIYDREKGRYTSNQIYILPWQAIKHINMAIKDHIGHIRP